MESTFSVIIPAHNASSHLGACLQALREGVETPLEILVVDDGSTDNTRAIAKSFGARVLSTGRRMGPAFARNLGATEAAGDVLFFLDADVCVKVDTLSRITHSLDADPELDAIIGSYDNQPGAADFISQYRNLMHAFVHQTGAERASTFWSGCGAIRRSVFTQHSGFSLEYKRPAIEDIELGYRLHRAGQKIVLDRQVQVTHLKRWTFWGLVKTDMLDRGIPWTELILRDRRMPDDLNLQLSQRISVALVFVLVALSASLVLLDGAYLIAPLLAIVFLMLARWWGEIGSHQRPRRAFAVLVLMIGLVLILAYASHMRGLIPPLVAAPALLWLRHRYSRTGKLTRLHRSVGLIFIGGSLCGALFYLPAHRLILAIFVVVVLLGLMNSQFYIFLAGKRGVAFMLAAIPFHVLYHFYNGLSFIAGMSLHYTRNLRAPGNSSHAVQTNATSKVELTSPLLDDHSSAKVRGRPPTVLGLQAKELAILVLYIAMVSFAVFFYQQSEDEGRAWILSRSFPLREMLFHILRYEGHPGLYYLLLWGFSHAGFPFTAINWFFAATASAGIYLLLRFSPFPFYLRALLPFGFFLGFQYAAVARSYALFPLLGFSAAHLYRQLPARPAAMALVLALLANVSLHGTMVATGFAAAYAVQILQQRRGGSLSRGLISESWFGAGLFTTSILFVALCVWPAKYMNLSFPDLVHKVTHRLTGPVPSSSIQRPGAGGASLRLVAFVPVTPATPSTQSGSSLSDSLADRLYLAFIYPIATYPVLALLYEGLIVMLLFRRRKLILLLPFALLAYFLVDVYVQVWHTGLMWITLLLILWAAWEKEVRPTGRTLQNAIAALLVLLCALQMRWTFLALVYEKGHAAYPSKAAASYLKTLSPSARINGNEIAFSVMPYFPHYIFLDEGPARFTGHRNYPADVSVPNLVAEQPDVILLRSTNITAGDRSVFGNAGYSEQHKFCGGPYYPNWPIVPVCISTFERH